MTDEVEKKDDSEKKDPFAAARAAKAAKREAERIAAAFAAARAAKAAKREAERIAAAEALARGETPPAPEASNDEPKVEASPLPATIRVGPSLEDRSVWFQALLTVMRNREVKAAPDVKACAVVADEVLSVYKDKFK